MQCDDLKDEQLEKQATVTNTTLLMSDCTGPGLSQATSDTDGGHRFIYLMSACVRHVG